MRTFERTIWPGWPRIVMGLVVGLNAAGIWPQVPLHAVATHGQDNFAICTAPMDHRRRGGFRARRRHRRSEGRGAEYPNATLQHVFRIQRRCKTCRTPNTKNPHYRIVSGMTNIRQTCDGRPTGRQRDLRGRDSPADKWWPMAFPGCQGVPRRRSRIKGSLVPLDRWQFRTTAIRNP